MTRFHKAALVAAILCKSAVPSSQFTVNVPLPAFSSKSEHRNKFSSSGTSTAFTRFRSLLEMSTATPPETSSDGNTVNDFNAVHVAKTGGRGVASTSQDAFEKNLSLGAPGDRPQGGHFLTRGGVQVTAHVEPLTFVNTKTGSSGTAEGLAPHGSSARAVEDLVEKLDYQRGVLLSSSYEFPGRYVCDDVVCLLCLLIY